MDPKQHMNYKNLLLFVFIIILLFSRFYNLENSSRFIWDESSDLVNMHRIWVEKDLTLIGPISEDGNKVFSSLTYYMLLPFSVITNFDPVGAYLGTAVFGVLTSVLLFVYIKKLRSHGFMITAVLLIVWYPFLLSQRWAWNPNLIPFWIVLAVLGLLKQRKLNYLLGGMFLGLTIHHHYLSFFASSIFVILFSVYKYKHGMNLAILASLFSGFVLSILPFIIFDLTHPPGLFLSRILYFNYLGDGFGFNIFGGLFPVFKLFGNYFFPSGPFWLAGAVLTVLLFVSDMHKKRGKALIYGSTVFIHLMLLGAVSNVYEHYLLPIAVFFLIWLYIKRDGFGKALSVVIIVLMIASSLFKVDDVVLRTGWESGIDRTKKIVNIVEEDIIENDLKNPNIAVLKSNDPNIYGRRYRDLMLIGGEVELLSKDKYNITDNLFVVTQSNVDEVLKDPAYEVNNFRNGKVVFTKDIGKTGWKVIRVDKN